MILKWYRFWIVSSLTMYLYAQINLWKTLHVVTVLEDNQQYEDQPDSSSTSSWLVVRLRSQKRRIRNKQAKEMLMRIAKDMKKDGMKFTVPNTPGAFIHLGKTGGSSLSKLLKNGCHSFIPKPCQNVSKENETPLSKLTTYYHAPDFPDLVGIFVTGEPKLKRKQVVDHDFYVFTTRDPFDRIQSAFQYSMPDNQLAYRFNWKLYNETLRGDPSLDPSDLEEKMKKDIMDNLRSTGVWHSYQCFPNLQTFVDYIGDSPLDYKDVSWVPVRKDCTHVARLAVHHKIGQMQHLFWDLKKLTDAVNITGHHASADDNHSKPILAVRKEFLWNDWSSANKMFGRDGGAWQQSPVHEPHERDSSSLPLERTSLTDVGRERLCNAIKDDYNTYFEVLTRAVNLEEQDLVASMDIAKRNCPMLHINTNLFPLVVKL